jgi:predicted DNA-binding transcriptional regulator AlpA
MSAKQSSETISAVELESSPLGFCRVIDLKTWAKLASLSVSSAKREIACGRGPKTIQLSPRRIGIRVADHVAWLNEHQRGGLKN